MNAKWTMKYLLMFVVAIGVHEGIAMCDELPPTLSSGRVIIYNPLQMDETFSRGQLCKEQVFSPNKINMWTINSAISGGFQWTREKLYFRQEFRGGEQAYDCAGRQAFASTWFSIDRTDPEIFLYFVEDGGCYPSPVWPTWGAFDENMESVSAWLDGQPFENGSEVTAEGLHDLLVQAEDTVGHQSQISVSFIIDDTDPVLTVAGVQDGEFYPVDVVATFSATDTNPVETYAILDENDYVSGTLISEEGEHEFLAVATDCAGNQDAFAASFVIDKTPPLIVVEGVEDGGVYGSPVTPVVRVSDEYLDQVVVELDGEAFSSGTEVSEEGTHLLWVYASDLAGNESNASVEFEIRLHTRPPFGFAVCAFRDVLIENNAGVKGFDTATGQMTYGGDVAAHGDVSMLNNAHVMGDVVAGGDVELRHNADTYGNLYLAGSLTLRNNAEVHGEVTELGVAPEPCECGYDVNYVLAYRSEHNDNAILESDTDIAPYLENGSLHVAKNKHVTLPGGIYYFQSVELENNAELSLEPGAAVELYIEQEFVAKNNADVSNDPYRAEDLLIVLGTDAEQGEELHIENNADLGLMLYAPRADLVYSNNVDLYGGIVVRDFHEENNGHVMVYEELTSDPPPLVCE